MKISALFLVLMLSLFNVFGQINRFDAPPALEDINIKRGIISPPSGIYPTFTMGEVKYIVSYDTLTSYKRKVYPKERDLYIYRWDEATETWVKASDLVQKDYETFTREFHHTYDSYLEHMDQESSRFKMVDFGFGNIFQLENGYVVMFITNEYYTYHYVLEGVYKDSPAPGDEAQKQPDGSYFVQTRYINESNSDYEYNSIIICIPNADRTYYTCTRFEPPDRKTHRNEASKLAAGNAKIRIRDDGISIDMFIKVKNENYVNPVTNAKTESDYEKRDQLEYDNAISKLIKTYNFTINDKAVIYYGDDLIQKK